MPRMVDRDDDDDEKCPHLGVSPPQLRHAPSVTIRHQQHSHSAYLVIVGLCNVKIKEL